MKYQPKTEKECNEMRLLPAADYDFEILKAKEMTSAAGDPMIKVSLRLFMPDGTFRMFDDFILLTENWAHKLRALCRSIGLIEKYESGKLDVEDFTERAGACKLGLQKRKDTGEEQNTVKSYLFDEEVKMGPQSSALKAKPPTAEPAKKTPDDSDEIPF